MKSCLICYNPFSGKQRFDKQLEYVRKRLRKKYDNIDTYRSLNVCSITEKIKECGSSYDLILVSGGDGSLNEAINGIMALDKKPTLAYIPQGTVNDIGHMLKLKKKISKTLDVILAEKPVKMDVCQVENKYFLYAAGIGKFTNVSYDAPYRLKRKLGKMAYFIEAAKNLAPLDAMEVTIEANGEIISGRYFVILALNSNRVAGFHLHRKRKSKLNDGIIDLTLIDKIRHHMSIFSLILFFLLGDRWKNGVRTLRVSEALIKTKLANSYNLDGEHAFDVNEAHLKVHKEAIEIIVNKKVRNKYFN